MAWGGQEKKRAEETILRKLKKCHERAMNINAFLRRWLGRKEGTKIRKKSKMSQSLRKIGTNIYKTRYLFDFFATEKGMKNLAEKLSFVIIF